MSDDFSDLLERLVDAGVDFVVVGGFAGIVHGSSYITQDIDICCDFSPTNLLSIQQALSDLHPVHRMTPTRKKLDLTGETSGRFKNLYLDTDIGQLDCLSFITGVGGYEDVKQASEEVKVDRVGLRVLSLDGLIKAKKAMNRPRDKQMLRELEAIRKLNNQ